MHKLPLTKILLVLVLLFICGQPSISSSEAAKDSKTFNLSLAHFWPAVDVVETIMVQGWAKEIEAATNGRVKIKSFPGGTLIAPQETYEGVVQGVVDIGVSVYAYTRGRFPVIETFILPGIGAKSSEVGSLAAMEAIKKFNPQELQDTKQLWTWGSGPMDLLSSIPIRKMEDFRGVPLGVPGGKGADTLKALGGSPVSMPVAEWYESLRRGVIKGGIVAVRGVDNFRLGEVTADYITFTPFFTQQLFFVVMNLDTWNSFPPDIQKIIAEVSENFYPKHVPRLWDDENTKAVTELGKQKKVEYITFSDQEIKKCFDAVKPVQYEHIDNLNSKGLPGEEILKTIIEITERLNKQYPDVSYKKVIAH